MIVASHLRYDPIYVTVYLTWMKIVIMEAIPYMIILTLNICIMRQVYSGSKFRNSFNTKSAAVAAADVTNGSNNLLLKLSSIRKSIRKQREQPSIEASIKPAVVIVAATQKVSKNALQQMKFQDQTRQNTIDSVQEPDDGTSSELLQDQGTPGK